MLKTLTNMVPWFAPMAVVKKGVLYMVLETNFILSTNKHVNNSMYLPTYIVCSYTHVV